MYSQLPSLEKCRQKFIRYSWGTTEFHKLGHTFQDVFHRELSDRRTVRGTTSQVVGEPAKIEGLSDVSQVQCGLQYSVKHKVKIAHTEEKW
jgi:Regulator of chromosome condensation (RCC1) repeat